MPRTNRQGRNYARAVASRNSSRLINRTGLHSSTNEDEASVHGGRKKERADEESSLDWNTDDFLKYG